MPYGLRRRPIDIFAAARLTWVFVIVVNLALVWVLEPFKRLFRPSDCRYSTR
jgi:hypothetical protein